MEKKLVSVSLRIEESLLLKAKALAEHSGITESAFMTVERADGSEKSYAQCLVTPKGVAKLSLLFAHKMACDASTSEV